MALSLQSLLKRGSDLEKEHCGDLSWTFSSLGGEVIEMPSGPMTCAISFAGDLILSAQTIGEPCAWVYATKSIFFPPDFDTLGVDLNALALIKVDSAQKAAYSAERLIKSGGFGCVVVDLPRESWFSVALQKRIANYVRKERACVLYLIQSTEGEDYERLGSSTSIFAESAPLGDRTHRLRLRKKGRRFECIKERDGTPGLR